MEVDDLEMMESLSPDSRGHLTAGLQWSETDLPREAVTADTGMIPVTAPRLPVPGIEVTEQLSDTGIDTVQEAVWCRSVTWRGTPAATWYIQFSFTLTTVALLTTDYYRRMSWGLWNFSQLVKKLKRVGKIIY